MIFFPLSLSGMSVMLLELMLPTLSAALSLSICQGKKKKKPI